MSEDIDSKPVETASNQSRDVGALDAGRDMSRNVAAQTAQISAQKSVPGMDPGQREQLEQIVDEAFKNPDVRKEFADILAERYGKDPEMREFLDVLGKSVENVGRSAAIDVTQDNSASKDQRTAANDSASTGEAPVSTAVTADRPDANQQVVPQPKPRISESVSERAEVLQEPDTARSAPDKNQERGQQEILDAVEGPRSGAGASTGTKEKPQDAHNRRDVAKQVEVKRTGDKRMMETVTRDANDKANKPNERAAQTEGRNKLEPRSRIEPHGRG